MQPTDNENVSEMVSRNKTLSRIQNVLQTPDGEVLMEELRLEWDGLTLLGPDPQKTGYNVGKRDCYKFLEALQSGELIR